MSRLLKTLHRLDSWRGLPLVAGLIILSLTAGVWRELDNRERTQIRHGIRLQAENAQHEIRARLDSLILALDRMARRWEIRGDTSRLEWEADAQLYVRHFSGYRTLALIQEQKRQQWVIQLSHANNQNWEPYQLTSALEQARHQGQNNLMAGFLLPDQTEGLQVTIPLIRNNQVQGFVIAVLALPELLKDIVSDHIAPGHAIALSQAGEALHCLRCNRYHEADWSQQVPLPLPGTTWQIQAWPSPETLREQQSGLSVTPLIVLIVGPLFALLFGMTLHLGQTARRRAAALASTNQSLTAEIVQRQATETARQKLAMAVEQSANAIVITDAGHTIEYVNPAFETITGYAAEEVIGNNAHILQSGQHGPDFYRQLKTNLTRGEIFRTVFTNRRKNGELFYEAVTIAPIKNGEGTITHYVATGEDVTEKTKAEEDLRKLSKAIEQSISSVVIMDAMGQIEYVNPQFTRSSGYSPEEAVGKPITLLKSALTPSRTYVDLWNTITSGEMWSGELQNVKKTGQLYWELVSISPVRNHDGVITHFVSIQHDITERKRMEEQLNYLAYYDELTHLPNRNLLFDRFAQAAARAKRRNKLVALLTMDIDRFKLVNDSLGHNTGDRVLATVAGRMTECAREGDTLARYGGDEFIMLLPDLDKADAASRIAQRILDTISPPMLIEARELRVTGSIGISLFPNDGEDTDTLMRNADAAMYRAKELGRNRFLFFTEELNALANERLTMESDLRLAVEREQLLLHYQPKLSLKTGEILGFEALVRWQHPTKGLVPPDRFIPLAEETGLIKPLGEWVLRTACRQAQAWRARGANISMAVNLSVRQLERKNLTRTIEGILAETGLEGECLELELTESAVMRNPEDTVEVLRQLKLVGVKLAIDDFGTGYSSLAYLQRFPFDTLKIDRSFINNLTTSPDEAAIAKTIIAMAHSLRLNVVAEGVETEAQTRYLQRLGCEQMQGFYFSRPLPVEAAEVLLNERRRLALELSSDQDYPLLIVDDDENVARALRRLLASKGYRTLVAGSAEEAFDLLATSGAAVVISDQHMPVMNGIEFLSRVKELYPETIRISLSGKSDIDMLTRAVNQGSIYKFITKPWDNDELLASIDEALKAHKNTLKKTG